jgi:hypothetical protein
MNLALRHGRRLLNAGNFREQTIGGVVMSGTHGFGPRATVAEAVKKFHYVSPDHSWIQSSERVATGTPCVAFDLETGPLTAFEVVNCACRLSGLPTGKEAWRGYTVFPYSHPTDPICFVVEYFPTDREPTYFPRVKPMMAHSPWKWRLLNAWWTLDYFAPRLRKLVQRGLGQFEFRRWSMVTDRHDIDAQYHPWPTLDGMDDPKLGLWAYKPTYTCHNVALFSSPEDTSSLIRYAIKVARKINPSLFRCFIGVRQLSTACDVQWAGNYIKPRDAIDFYCSVDHAEDMRILQQRIQAEYDVIPHRTKTCGIHS